jgi:branched-chain amino acid transport system permease protein
MTSLAKSVAPFVIGLSIAGALYVALPVIVGIYNARIVMDVGIAMILAVSLNIVCGMTGQFSIGHAGFMALGGYAAATMSYYGSLLLWGTSAKHTGFLGAGDWLFVVSCIVGGLIAAVAGYLVGLPSLRLRGDYLAIVTLGFGEILRVCLQQTNPVLRTVEELRAATWSELLPPPVGESLGFDGVPKYTNLFWVYAFLTFTVVAAYRLKQSGIGRSMFAVREDEIAAQAMGVNVAHVKVLAFVLAAFFAGSAGGLYAHESGINISPKDAGFQRSFEYLIMVVLGGSGSISGVMLAAALLTALPEVLRDFEEYRLIVYAVLLVGMMIVRPQGLFGMSEIWDFVARRTRKRTT